MKFRIGELASILNVSTNTIRRYEKMGYIESKRAEKNGYRYYSDGDITKFVSVRLKRKYGFTHEDLFGMEEQTIEQIILNYEAHMKNMDEQIEYLTHLRHRLKDDILLMKKAEQNSDIGYVKECNSISYVLFQEDDKILDEPDRLAVLQEYLYKSPEVQLMYIIKKDDFINRNYIFCKGWSVKQKDVERFNLKQNRYTIRYDRQKSLMCMVKLPIELDSFMEESENVDSDSLNYSAVNEKMEQLQECVKSNNYVISGDILGIVVNTIREDNKDYQYVLINIPIIETDII